MMDCKVANKIARDTPFNIIVVSEAKVLAISFALLESGERLSACVSEGSSQWSLSYGAP